MPASTKMEGKKGADYLNSSTSRMYRFKPYVDPLDAIKAKYTHPLGKALYESQAQNLFILVQGEQVNLT